MIARDFLQPEYSDINLSITSLNMGLVVTDDEIDYFDNLFSADIMRTDEGIEKFSNYVQGSYGALGEDPFPLFHTFGAGTYTREIHIPKGYVVIGKMHRGESMVYMLKGKVLVSDKDGVKTIQAPCQFVSKGGIKRVGYVMEDVVWIDIHATDKTTIEDAENEIFMSPYESMINELGYSVEEVRRLSEIKDDIINTEINNIEIKESNIEGKGCFTKAMIKKGHDVGVARIGLNRTILGRYVNHSFSPNTTCEVKNNSIYFIAINDIDKDEEISIDYKKVRKSANELDEMLNTQSNNGWLSCQVQ